MAERSQRGNVKLVSFAGVVSSSQDNVNFLNQSQISDFKLV